MKNIFFDAIPENPEVDRFIDISYEFSESMLRIIKRKNISNKDLAEKIGETEDTLAEMFYGNFDFTIRQMVRIELALEERLIHINLHDGI